MKLPPKQPKDPLDDLKVEGIPVGKAIKVAKTAKGIVKGVKTLKGLLKL
jgi:hypothetical protein